MTGGSHFPHANSELDDTRLVGVAKISGPNALHLPILTVGLLGVQVFWSVEMAYAPPYLLSLGMTKSTMAIVFLAGPISGLVMQPLIGAVADASTSSWGRRRPFMLAGSLVCILAMLSLGWSHSIAGWITTNTTLALWIAIFAVFLIDFSINAVQAVDRALIVDTLPPARQDSGNAWAARMLGCGSVLGFFLGNLDLPYILPFLGETEIEGLSIIVGILLFGVHIITLCFVQERVLEKQKFSHRSARSSFLKEVKKMLQNVRELPSAIRQICIIQFFSWIAWFPILFFTTTYIGDLYKFTYFDTIDQGSLTDVELAEVDAEATRLGSRALFYSSVLALAANWLLPYLIVDSSLKVTTSTRSPHHATGLMDSNGCFNRLQMHEASMWTASHALLSVCMLSTFLNPSVPGATALLTVTGISWAITQWIPFSLLAQQILQDRVPVAGIVEAGHIRLNDVRRADTVLQTHTNGHSVSHQISNESSHQVYGTDEDENENDPGEDVALVNGSQYHDGSTSSDTSLSSKAGVILGVHNIFIVIPQFIVTGISSIIFAILDPDKSAISGPHRPPPSSLASRDETSLSPVSSTVYVFRIGGVSSAIACILCWRLADQLRRM